MGHHGAHPDTVYSGAFPLTQRTGLLPYYEEWYLNDSIVNTGTYHTNATLQQAATGHGNVDLTHLVGFRTRPPSGGKLVAFSELPDSKADPYTVFIDQNRAKRDAAVYRGFDTALFSEDRGHPFELLRYKSEGGLWSGYMKNTTFGTTFRGSNLDLNYYAGSMPFQPGFPAIGWTDLPAYAQATYAKAAPTPSVFNLAQFLGELREGLPRLGLELLTKSKTFKALGSDYLNVEFGWKPFISDLQSSGEALMGATTALLGPRGPMHRLRREDPADSMRSFTYGNLQLAPTTWEGTDTTDIVSYPMINSFGKLIAPNPLNLGNGNVRLFATNATMSERTESERWFEGSFSFIPKIGFNPDSYVDKLGQLVSTEITPSVLWELAPWSWLTDWFLKIGNTIAANEVASDNRIVSNYAYAMEKRVITRGLLATGLTSQSYTGPSTIARQWTTTGKRRIRANPYGFKPMTTANLNTNQWLIMAALGLTTAAR